MHRFHFVRQFSFALLILLTALPSQAAALRVPVRLDSDEGAQIFKRAATPQALALLANYETQSTKSLCGIASAVMVLNSLTLAAPQAFFLREPSYFTQHNIFSKPVERIVAQKLIEQRGMALAEVAAALRSWDAPAEAIYARDLDLARFRTQLRTALDAGEFVIVNYARAVLAQKGTGHHSPIAAYDEASDSILLLDVARYAYPALWVPTAQLWDAVRFEAPSHPARGYVVVHKPWVELAELLRAP